MKEITDKEKYIAFGELMGFDIYEKDGSIVMTDEGATEKINVVNRGSEYFYLVAEFDDGGSLIRACNVSEPVHWTTMAIVKIHEAGLNKPKPKRETSD